MDLNEFLKKSYILGGHCPLCNGFYFTEVVQKNPLIIQKRCLKCGNTEDITEKVKNIVEIKQIFTPVRQLKTRNIIAYKILPPFPPTTGNLNRNGFEEEDSLKSYEDLLKDMIL